MPYVTQAGVGLGLAIEVGGEFSDWGAEFSTLVIAVIVLNQFLLNGSYTWTDVQVDTSGNYTLQVSGGALSSAISSTITASIPPVINNVSIPVIALK